MSTLRFDAIEPMRAQIRSWRAEGHSIGLVPTMGNLHGGHEALIETARAQADRVITTIFPNPTQFAASEDFATYPRSEAEDLNAIARLGGHGVFIPQLTEIYPKGFATKVWVEGLSDCLCGAARPHHFSGVTQIVTKLLNQASPDIAVFGEKDWQQLVIIKRLVRDLDFATRIVSVPTVRDDFGLALSSRNGYLSQTDLAVARQFNGVLARVAGQVARGGDASAACKKATAEVLDLGFEKVDYLECRDGQSLAMLENVSDVVGARIFGAAHLAGARLIDNCPIK